MENTLISKIAKASINVGALKPDKTNTQQNYSYISADKMLDRAGNALAQVGVVVMPSITNEETRETSYTDNYGKAKTRYDAVVTFDMLVSDGESELRAAWVGRGSDYAVPDKALYKAITSGHKYYLAKLLNIGVGNEDGEHEEEVDDKPQAALKPTGKPQSASRPQVDTKVHVDSVGDVIFTTEPSKPVLSDEQLKELNIVGREFYGDEWDEQRPVLVQAVSKGAVTSSKELMPQEADKLIKGIRKKMTEVAMMRAAKSQQEQAQAA